MSERDVPGHAHATVERVRGERGSGSWTMVVDGDTVTVTVTIDDPVGEQTASGSVQAQTGP